MNRIDIPFQLFSGGLMHSAVPGALTALLSRLQPAHGLAPFALAFFSAALAAGINPVLPALGCAVGLIHPEGFSPMPLYGMASAAGGFLILQLADRYFPADKPLAERWLSFLAGLSALLPGLSLAAGGAWQSLRLIGSTVAAAASAPFFLALLRVRPSRRHLMPEERTGLITLLCASAAGLTALWPPLAVTASMCAALIASPLGAGAAACVGLGAGASMIVAGLEPVRAAGVGLCGMLAGMTPPKQKWLSPALLSLGALAAFLTMGVPWMDPVCALTAAAVSLMIPERWSARAAQWLSGDARGACDPDRLAMRLRAASERKLRALSDAFGEMSDSYRVPADVPDEQRLIADMRERLCENCPNYAQCWVGGDNRAVRFLCQLISEAIGWANGDCAEPLFGDEMPPDVLRQCQRGRSIPQRLGVLLEEFARRRRSELKRGQMNQLISAQFLQAQMLLCGLADAQSAPMRIRGRQAVRARAALDRAGIEAGAVMALRGARRMEIIAELRCGRWSPELAARASAELSRTFGRAYAPADGADSSELRFVRLPRLRAAASACCHSRQAGVPCGDSHMIRELEGDKLLLMISDGMGSGEAAARESAQTLRLLSRFLAADVRRELALETVNELMLARTDSDMFATVDLCTVDLIAGVAEFSKLAACRSVILRRGEEIISVEGGRLPLGILEGVRPSSCRVELMPGDVIVMASDGVMEVMEEETLERILIAHSHLPPEMLAETIVSRAERYSGVHRDDMTVVCARIGRLEGRRAA